MPIHNWTGVGTNLFHDFHQSWSVKLCHALNGGLLPKGFSALVERHGGDVLSQRRDLHPQEIAAALGNRVTIRRPLTTVVSVIEIVSPGNKSSRSALRSFVEKTVEFLRGGVHVLVVDLFPPSVRDPQGIHKAIWDEIEDQPFTLPPERPLTLVTYLAGLPKTAFIELCGVGEALPDMPAYLDLDSYVPVPLEATYQATWATCPEDMREVVEHGEMLDEAEEDGE